MSRIPSITQRTILASDATAPIYLIDIDLTGEQHLSTNGTHLIDTTLYESGEVSLQSIDGFETARIFIPRTAERDAAILAGGWRGKECRIWLLPSEGGEEPTQGERILLLDGVLDAAESLEWAEVTVVHRAFLARWAPWIRIAPPIANHLPPAGSVLEWEGERVTLEE